MSQANSSHYEIKSRTTDNPLRKRVRRLEYLARKCNVFYTEHGSPKWLEVRMHDDAFCVGLTIYDYTEQDVSRAEQEVERCERKVDALGKGFGYLDSAMLLLEKAGEIFKEQEEPYDLINRVQEFLERMKEEN